uniref:NPC intracellular cholesterol transporter 1 isoform X2 n=1 Tax=Ciona intestinalis TaxID=7719 RepID=UPI00089DC53A|nr:NPC intracellular cholesterol transporter 1 isoform X2 [Ciona intestinalis]|eukprot:XP_018672975.1 NPC intracellular cholesterol transporter 1 isoform X2 [Ciona intestinalis]
MKRTFCFIVFLFVLIIQCYAQFSSTGKDNFIHKDGYCIMYDECATNVLNKKNLNCFYNGKAKKLEEQTGLDILLQLCPYMYKGPNLTYTCCSTKQLQTLQSNLQLPYQYLSRCPACFSNFVAMFCEMTCSTDQSTFTTPETLKNTSTDTIHMIKNQTYVSTLSYTMTNQYAESMFNSCSHVSSPSTNTPALNLLCGPYADKCNAQNWITYMNSISNGLAPFQIDVTFSNDTSVGMNYQTGKCNETQRNGDGACSCNDCPTACAGPPPQPPKPSPPWTIFGIDGYYITMTFVYGGFCVVFLFMVFIMHLCCKSGNKYSTFDESCCTVVDDSTVSARDDDLGVRTTNSLDKPLDCEDELGVVERWGLYLENGLRSAFRKWGIICARHPFIILLAGFILVGVSAFGLKFMTITTDPVELWSAPSSEARLRKDYFDQHFGPFYRTEQMIITAKNSSTTYYQPYSSSSTGEQVNVTFGSILRKDVLHEILDLQLEVERLTAKLDDETVTLKDICLKPLAPYNNNCTIMSVVNYFQNDHATLDKEAYSEGGFFFEADYHDHLMACLSGAASIDDATKLHLSCLGTFGGPVFPWVALGGFNGTNYLEATAAVVTFPVVNYYNNSKKLAKAMAWEKRYIEFMKEYVKRNGSKLNVAFTSERSIEDEINRESGADVMTIIASYLIMFAYVAIALGRFGSCRLGRTMVDCQLTVGLSGVMIVLCSVVMALGIFSYANVPLTLIIVEVIPFLALAVGVDNIFILVQHYQRDNWQPRETPEERLGRVLGEVAPSMFMSSISETVAFFLGGLSTMPAVRTFSMMAGLAIFCDFLLQISCFVAILALDNKRQNSNRFDCLCCIKDKENEESENDGILYLIVKNYFSPAVLSSCVRPIVICIFAGFACFSGAVLHKVDIGLDQSLSMPEDSYVLDYFDGMNNYLSVGAPVYFVVKDGQNYTDAAGANQICGGMGCNNNSLIEQIARMSKMPNYSHIAYPASSWLDDYFDWLKPQSSCCRHDNTGEEDVFCNATVVSTSCIACRSAQESANQSRPTPDEFMKFLPWFLNDNPETKCAKGGHAAYGTSVKVIDEGKKSRVGATSFMAYHTLTKTSKDFIGCLRSANEIAEQISQNTTVEVFPYSVFYVFYEQYLTIVHDTIFNLGVSLAAIFVVVFFLLGFDLLSAVIVVVTILLILLDMFGAMYLWNIPLNAVSLVNLVMAVGISVEFCAHITRAFALSQRITRVARAEEALAEIGSSVLSGITLTKFVGIVILAFSKSQIFKVFYFRMYLCVVVLGAGHGLVFLPVLLSYIGPRRRKGQGKHKVLVNDDVDHVKNIMDDGRDPLQTRVVGKPQNKIDHPSAIMSPLNQ